MNWLARIFRRGAELDQEIDDELRFHIERRIERYTRSGMTPEKARRKALDRFGNLDEIRRAVREIDLGTIESVWQDVRYAARTLAKSPGFTAVALLSLALGIGLNSAIFSAINAVLLRPLPYRDPERIVGVSEIFPEPDDHRASPANYLDWEKQNRVFEAMAAYDSLFLDTHFVLATRGETESVTGLRVSTNFFRVLGVQPALGRTFLPEEDKPGTNVVILSHDLWRRRFAADPNILGQDITLTGAGYRVIGVMPREFRYYAPANSWTLRTSPADLWLPSPFEKSSPTNRHSSPMSVIARLKPGVTLEQARADIHLVLQRLAKEYPQENTHTGARVDPLLEELAGQSRSSLLFAWGAVGLVLLIACANVANLMLARDGTRKREIAIRTAIGAGRSRLVRQLLAETVLLAVAGAAAGPMLALWSAKLLSGLLPDTEEIQMVRLDEAGVNLPVLGFTLLISLVTAVLVGLVPALRGSKVEIHDALGGAGRSTEGREGMRLRGALVVLQVALSLVLLAGAGLMVNSFWRLHQIRLGFRADHLLTLRSALDSVPPYVTEMGIKEDRFGNKLRHWVPTSQSVRFPERVIERLEKLPGVESAAVASTLPMARTSGYPLRIEGQPGPSPEQEGKTPWVGDLFRVTPGYFHTMGIRVSQGRDFNEADTPNTKRVAIINQYMARAFWPHEPNVIGKRIIIMDWPAQLYEIIGVAEDVRAWPREKFSSQVYASYTQPAQPFYTDLDNPSPLDFWFAVRTRVNPAALGGAVRHAMREVDKGAAVEQIRPMDEVVSAALGPWRSTMLLLGFLAGLALLLSAIGIYGVISYAVAQRTHEIGVRMALGAGRGNVLRLVMKSGLSLALGGVVFGATGAYWLTRLIANQLYDVTPTDPLTFASMALLLLAVALLACYLPARRAARLDPMAALRCE